MSGSQWSERYAAYILLFDITETNRVKLAILDTIAYDYIPGIGIYGGKLCIIKTDYISSEWWIEEHRYSDTHWSRLYSIEKEGLVEIVDVERHNIEIFFKTGKERERFSDMIIEKHIPVETGVEDIFQKFQENDIYDTQNTLDSVSFEPESASKISETSDMAVETTIQPEGIKESESTLRDSGNTKGFSHILTGIGILLPIGSVAYYV
jgi:hypothetical protein